MLGKQVSTPRPAVQPSVKPHVEESEAQMNLQGQGIRRCSRSSVHGDARERKRRRRRRGRKRARQAPAGMLPNLAAPPIATAESCIPMRPVSRWHSEDDGHAAVTLEFALGPSLACYSSLEPLIPLDVFDINNDRLTKGDDKIEYSTEPMSHSITRLCPSNSASFTPEWLGNVYGMPVSVCSPPRRMELRFRDDGHLLTCYMPGTGRPLPPSFTPLDFRVEDAVTTTITMTRIIFLAGLVAAVASGLQIGSAPAVGYAMVRRDQQGDSYNAGADNNQAPVAKSGSANYGGYDSTESMEESSSGSNEQSYQEGSSEESSSGSNDSNTEDNSAATNTYGNSADGANANYPAGAASPTQGVYQNTEAPVYISEGSTPSSSRVALALGFGAVALALGLS
ncbi:hypothetical protein L249_0650 [Ophiocordyceps polyrhachis-furcata BCC 54312]|uniref:Uncharacterized protein n=1 Tax=Ophiocordyceps polyrhachis-furcata BCC 54312 TaxID=1330021 RepID=A0A367LF72_9HYPO|nr:hypothetical protein L249_0650 [Ophiocordyceps polyrhachis-furcata BCC 54312]